MKSKDKWGLIVFGLIVLLIFLSSSDRPIFLGALTGFTQTGNELKFTSSMVENGTATITRTLILDHGNVTSAYIDIFPTPTISTASIAIDDIEIWSIAPGGEPIINVQRIDITNVLLRDNCQDCIVYFDFLSDDAGSILVTELDVTYGIDPSINEPLGEGPDEITNPYNVPQNQEFPKMEEEQKVEEQLETVQDQAKIEQKYLFYIIIGVLLYLLWERGPKNGFSKTI